MNNVLWGAVCKADYSIPFDYQEAHLAYTEGYYDFQPWKISFRNPYEEDTDSWHEWNDGHMQAYQNYLFSMV